MLGEAVDHGEVGPVMPALNGAVVVRFRLPNGPDVSKVVSRAFSLSLSSAWRGSLKSVRRRVSDGGGVTVLESSRANLEALGEAREVDGNGKASDGSRRRFPERAPVGDAIPKAPGLF